MKNFCCLNIIKIQHSLVKESKYILKKLNIQSDEWQNRNVCMCLAALLTNVIRRTRILYLIYNYESDVIFRIVLIVFVISVNEKTQIPT